MKVEKTVRRLLGRVKPGKLCKLAGQHAPLKENAGQLSSGGEGVHAPRSDRFLSSLSGDLAAGSRSGGSTGTESVSGKGPCPLGKGAG